MMNLHIHEDGKMGLKEVAHVKQNPHYQLSKVAKL